MPTLDIHSPLQDAVDQMAGRRVTPSGMTAREWELLPSEIRLRAMFSSRVEHERTLSEMKERITDGLAGAKRDGATMDRSRFIEEMHGIIRQSGYKRPEDVKKGSLRDLKSSRRLGLIWDMNTAQARGYARWLADMDPEGLENEPSYELVRVMNRAEVRDWPSIWKAAGGKFYDGEGSNDDYPFAPGRMIAKKTDPIWRMISRFGTPWPPFDWGSGMGLRGIGIDEAEAFGIVSPDDDFAQEAKQTLKAAAGFNAAHSSSAANLPPEARENLRSTFGDAIRFDKDRIYLQRNLTPESDEQRKLDIGQSLRERSRNHYLQASEELQRLQRENDGAELGFGGEGESEIAEIYLAQACAVAVGRKRLFHDTMTQAEAETFLQVTSGLPEQVAASYRDGHFLMWRRDLEDIQPDSVIAEFDSGRGGLLLGYGLDSPAFRQPHVLVRIFRMPRAQGDLPVVGFHAPLDSWREYATARAKDISLAWGVEPIVEWEVKP